MFQPGEKVACVIDDWPDDWPQPLKRLVPKFELTKGAVYTVRKVYPVGSKVIAPLPLIRVCVGIGKRFEALRAEVKLSRMPEWSTYDVWPADWFRRLQRNDESVTRAMSIFHQMTETTKAPEVIDA